MFTDLIALNIAKVNEDVQQLFNLIYNSIVPVEIQCYFTDTCLFCLYKDPDDLTKLLPVGIPSAIRCIIASHIAIYNRQWVTMKIQPHNNTVGIDGGMDCIIKSMQHSIEKYIQPPQKKERLPIRVVFF